MKMASDSVPNRVIVDLSVYTKGLNHLLAELGIGRHQPDDPVCEQRELNGIATAL